MNQRYLISLENLKIYINNIFVIFSINITYFIIKIARIFYLDLTIKKKLYPGFFWINYCKTNKCDVNIIKPDERAYINEEVKDFLFLNY